MKKRYRYVPTKEEQYIISTSAVPSEGPSTIDYNKGMRLREIVYWNDEKKK